MLRIPKFMEVFAMPRSPSRSRIRTLVRTSQRNRSEHESLCRAYELALPIVKQPLAETGSAKSSATKRRRRVA